jgi:hypothetical protein
MKRWIATVAVGVLFAGAAAADPPEVPAPDLAAEWEDVARRVDQKMDTELDALDAKTDSALRHHKAAGEVGRDAAGCNHLVAPAAAQGASASERHRRLTACLAQLRARDAMLAGSQP